MGSHATADETIWPTQNDIALTVGNGNKMLENQWEKPWAAMRSNNYALSGLTVPASSVNLNINVALGTAFIAGRHITIPGATAVTAAASSTNYVFLKLTRDGSNLVTGTSFEVNITNVPPADSIKICTLTASGTAITSTADARTFQDRIETIISGTTWTCPAGIFRIYAEVISASGGGGGGSGSPGSAAAGAAGTAGGTTTFGAMSVTGGGGGFGGVIGTTGGAQGANHGVGSSGHVNRTGGGSPGGSGGGGGGATSHNGGNGGDGGYAAAWIDVTPGADTTYGIGAAGGAGAAGAGSGGAGAAGRAGTAGMVLIHYWG